MCSNDMRASIAEVYIRSKDIILIEKQRRYRLNSVLAGEVGTMITTVEVLQVIAGKSCKSAQTKFCSKHQDLILIRLVWAVLSYMFS